jgi:hypothetical protein
MAASGGKLASKPVRKRVRRTAAAK